MTNRRPDKEGGDLSLLHSTCPLCQILEATVQFVFFSKSWDPTSNHSITLSFSETSRMPYTKTHACKIALHG